MFRLSFSRPLDMAGARRDYGPNRGSRATSMTDALRLDEIVEAGLCMGCGLCRSLAPDAIVFEMDRHGAETPRLAAPIEPDRLALVNALCPGLRMEGRVPEREDAEARWDVNWGPALVMAKAHAADPDVRFRGSAGGVLSALAIHLLEAGEIAFVLHIAADPERPMRARAQASRSPAEVLRGTGSRYAPAAPLTHLMQLLDRGERFAVIAKPCDVSAIENLSRRDARVGELIRYRLSFACGGASGFAKSLELVQGYGLDESEVSLLRFRGYGNPGKTRVESRDGRAFETTYNALWADEGTWRTFHRCKISGDAVGEMADIVATDVWAGGGPVGEDAGFNGVIARTRRGALLLERAVASGHLRLLGPMRFEDFDQVQPHQVRRKQALTARLAAATDAGLPIPDYRSLRLESAAAEADAAVRSENYQGMRARIARRRPADPG
jgi:coenzyme F420 hydrogenase subunit beta